MSKGKKRSGARPGRPQPLRGTKGKRKGARLWYVGGPSLVSWIKHSVDRFVIVSIFIPKLRLILILNSFLGSSDSLVFSELFHSLAPRPLAARSISDFLLTYLAT